MSHRSVRLGFLGAALLTSACVVSAPPAITINTPGNGGGGTGGSTSTPAPTPKATASATPVMPSAPASTKPSAAPSQAPANAAEVVDLEPNDDFPQAQAVMPGQTIKGTAGGDTEGDTYKFVIPAGVHDGWLTLEMDESDDDWISALRLYKGDKSYITTQSAESGTTQPWSHKWRVTAGGTYYVRVAAYDSASPYTLKTGFTPVLDPNEPNDDWAKATKLELGKPATFAGFWGEGDADYDLDYFRVTLPAGASTFKVNLTNNSTSSEPARYTFKLYKGDKSYVTSLATESQQSDIVDGELGTDLEAGDYYIVVTGDEAASALCSFSVSAY
ncbi:MAG: hypothetical protein VKS61_16265 [Candidatus Sericytochromatia bacterium]|nr:hypothetical protein [Candidatus Sericytochromatia bacterium]